MRIGLLSDTHDSWGNLKQALIRVERAGVDLVIHCGDLTRPIGATHFANFRVIQLLGNMDREKTAIRQEIVSLDPRNEVLQTYTGNLGGIPVAATHGHLPGKVDALVRAGTYRFVFHGHTHRRRDEQIAATRVINPGALGGTRHEPRSVCIVDLERGQVEFIEVAPW